MKGLRTGRFDCRNQFAMRMVEPCSVIRFLKEYRTFETSQTSLSANSFTWGIRCTKLFIGKCKIPIWKIYSATPNSVITHLHKSLPRLRLATKEHTLRRTTLWTIWKFIDKKARPWFDIRCVQRYKRCDIQLSRMFWLFDPLLKWGLQKRIRTAFSEGSICEQLCWL